MQLSCPAKINLFLHVTGRRPDGYHDLYTLMCGVTLCDTIELTFNAPRISVRCNHPEVPEDGTNLAYRAAKIFFERMGADRLNTRPGVEIFITKKIPVAGGLGGGSSNAAAVLVGLNRHYDHPFSRQQMMAMGLAVGADVPFFILGKPAVATGVGEVLSPVAGLPSFYVLLVNPGVQVSTASVYKNLNLGLTNNPKINKEPSFRVLKPDLVRCLYNDLETVTAVRCPEIRMITEALLANGAEGALMTGSGPTVFGLFDTRDSAQSAMDALSGNERWRLFLAKAICE